MRVYCVIPGVLAESSPPDNRHDVSPWQVGGSVVWDYLGRSLRPLPDVEVTLIAPCPFPDAGTFRRIAADYLVWTRSNLGNAHLVPVPGGVRPDYLCAYDDVLVSTDPEDEGPWTQRHGVHVLHHWRSPEQTVDEIDRAVDFWMRRT